MNNMLSSYTRETAYAAVDPIQLKRFKVDEPQNTNAFLTSKCS